MAPPPAKKQRISGGSSSNRKASSNNKKKASTTTSNNNNDATTTTTAIVRWLPRNELESIILNSLQDGRIVTITDVLNAIPESQKWRFEKNSTTGSGNKKKAATTAASSGAVVVHRQGTGSFDVIDDEILRQVFDYLPLRERIICVSTVCKSWRSYKTTPTKLFPGFFDDLSDDSLTVAGENGEITVARLQSLLEWLPNPTTTTTSPKAFRLSTTDKCHPNDAKKLLKQLSAYVLKTTTNNNNNKKKKIGLQCLETFILQGPKIYDSVLKASIKEKVYGPSLKKLVLVEVKNTSPTKISNGTLLDILKMVPNLEFLGLTHEISGLFGIQAIVGALMEARGGSPAVVRTLDFTQKGGRWISSEHESKFSWAALRDLAAKAPELEVLKIYKLYQTPVKQPLPKHGQPNPYVVMHEEYMIPQLMQRAFGMPLEVFPRLKTFQMERFTMRGRLETSTVRRALEWLLVAMPALQKLEFGCGSCYLTNKELKEFVQPATPSLGDNPPTTAWPQTLQELTLFGLELGRNELLYLPLSVQKIILKNCGPNMIPIAQDIVNARREATQTTMGGSQASSSSCIIGTDEHRVRNRWDTSRTTAIVFGTNPSLPKGLMPLNNHHAAVAAGVVAPPPALLVAASAAAAVAPQAQLQAQAAFIEAAAHPPIVASAGGGAGGAGTSSSAAATMVPAQKASNIQPTILQFFGTTKNDTTTTATTAAAASDGEEETKTPSLE